MATVLIVEDDQEIRELIGDILTLEGYEIQSMARLPHGLDRIRQMQPDVIVLDLGLPGIGGIELLRLLKIDPKLREVPIVICSGAEETLRAHEEEFADLAIPVVRKPFTLEQLLEAIRGACPPSRSGVLTSES